MKRFIHNFLILCFIFQNYVLLVFALDLANDEKLKEIKIGDLNFTKTQDSRFSQLYRFRMNQISNTNFKSKDAFKINDFSNDNFFNNKRYNSFDLNNNYQSKWSPSNFQKINTDFSKNLDLSKISRSGSSGGGRFKGKSLKLLLGIPACIASACGICFKCCRKNDKASQNGEGLHEVATVA